MKISRKKGVHRVVRLTRDQIAANYVHISKRLEEIRQILIPYYVQAQKSRRPSLKMDCKTVSALYLLAIGPTGPTG